MWGEIVRKLEDDEFSDSDIATMAEYFGVNLETVENLHYLILHLLVLDAELVPEDDANLFYYLEPLIYEIFTTLSYLATNLKSLRRHVSEAKNWLDTSGTCVAYSNMKNFIK